MARRRGAVVSRELHGPEHGAVGLLHDDGERDAGGRGADQHRDGSAVAVADAGGDDRDQADRRGIGACAGRLGGVLVLRGAALLGAADRGAQAGGGRDIAQVAQRVDRPGRDRGGRGVRRGLGGHRRDGGVARGGRRAGDLGTVHEDRADPDPDGDRRGDRHHRGEAAAGRGVGGGDRAAHEATARDVVEGLDREQRRELRVTTVVGRFVAGLAGSRLVAHGLSVRRSTGVSGFPSAAANAVRPRAMRDRTVPGGTSSTAAISA